jgi:DNA-binding transcriptional LysR family regulator
MHFRMSIDWNLARAFLMTAEGGSLSAAARLMGLTQPTLSRQVAELEGQLGVALYERIGKRLVLTDAGHGLLEHVRAMSEAADAMELAASGQSQAIEGRVRISATDGYSAYILPEIVERMRIEIPEVTIDLVSSDSLSDLRKREADIAIRNVRPNTDELIGKLVRESTAHLYASKEWVSQRGLPDAPEDIASKDVVCFSDPDLFAEYLRGVGVRASADEFRLIADNAVVAWELVKRGQGIGFMMREIADRTAGIVRLFPGAASIQVPVWLVTHRELRTSRRIRAVFDLLAEAFGNLSATPNDPHPSGN